MDDLFTIGVDQEDIGGGLLKHILQFWGADLCGFGENMISANRHQTYSVNAVLTLFLMSI